MMYRMLKTSGKWYATNFTDTEDIEETVQYFIDSGDVLILGDDLECMADTVGIDLEDIEIVDNDD